MDKIEYKLGKKILYPKLVLDILLIVAFIFMINSPSINFTLPNLSEIKVEEIDPITILFLIFIAFCIYDFLKSLKLLLVSNPPLMVMDYEGIAAKSLKMRKIYWSEIESAKIDKRMQRSRNGYWKHKRHFIVLTLTEIGYQRYQSLAGGLSQNQPTLEISLNQLDAKPEDIFAAFNEKWKAR